MNNLYPDLPIDAPWVVMKFGGTSVASADRWRNIRTLAAAHRAQGKRVLIVVSAMAGVTNALKDLCLEPDSLARGVEAFAIGARHAELADGLTLKLTGAAVKHIDSLHALAQSGSGEEGALAWRAQVQAHGELLSSAMGAGFLTELGLATTWVDSRDYLRTAALPNQNERTRVLSALIDAKPDAEFAARLASQGDVLIAQGFIARDETGRCVLLGRGGSDTSAACFGAILTAERVEIWTDVAGMFSANPRQVPSARLLRRLDYEEAQEIATTGARVLHPRCLSPLKLPRVPLWIRDTNQPQLEGTEIGPRARDTAPSVKAISTRKGITLISMESVGMWQQVGFLAEVFEAFRRHGLSVDLIGSAETNVTVSLDPTENLLDSDAVAALAADLAKVCRVKVIAPCAAVTLVGRGMRAMLHQLSSVLAEFGQLRVHLISQSSNNLNLTFVVDEEVVDSLLPRLHELLVRAGSLRSDDSELFGPTWQALYGQGEPDLEPAWWQGQRDTLLNLAIQRSPRYVYHLPTVLARVEALKSLRAVDHFYYAIKANPHPRLLQAIAGRGFSLECVSPGELLAAADAVPDADRLFTPNFARRADYAEAVRTGVPLTLDALHPLEHWGELFTGQSISSSIGVSCSRASPSCCGLILVAAWAITKKYAPAVLHPSSVCRWISLTTSWNWPAPTMCGCMVCMRIWAPGCWMRAIGVRCMRSLPVLPNASAVLMCSISAAALACRRTLANSLWIWPNSIASWLRSRKSTRSIACGWSRDVSWWPKRACCWQGRPRPSAKAV